jgi:hypothetical protein
MAAPPPGGPPAQLDENVPPEPGGARFQLQPYDPRRTRENARRTLAVLLLVLLAGVMLLILTATLFGNTSVEDAEDLATALVTPLIGLVGAAIGFYYGGDRGDGVS